MLSIFPTLSLRAVITAVLVLQPLALAQDENGTTDTLEPPTAEGWTEITAAKGTPKPTAQDLELVVYDVSDLVDPMIRNSVLEVGGADEGRTPAQLEEERSAMRKYLFEDVRRWISPPLAEVETLTMTKGGALVANLRPAAHTWLKSFLELQRRDLFVLYQVDTTIYSAEPASFDPLGIVRQTRFFGAEEAVELELLNAEILTAPRLSVFAGARANISVLNQTAYVKEYRHVVIAPGNQEILDPIVDVVQDGISIDTRIVSLPGGAAGLVMTAEFARLKRPIATKMVVVAEGYEPMEVGVPEVRRIELQTRARLAAGQTLLVTGRSKRADGTISSPFVWDEEDGTQREMAIAVHVERVEYELTDEGEQGLPGHLRDLYGDGERLLPPTEAPQTPKDGR